MQTTRRQQVGPETRALQQQEQQVQALLNPGCYEQPLAAVTVMETHISWVLLAGDFAYKLKKAVNFGEVLRRVGGHESFGAWSLKKAPALTWSEGDNWVSEDVELPVDGVFVYKYVVTDAQDAGKPVAWQKGNNQV